MPSEARQKKLYTRRFYNQHAAVPSQPPTLRYAKAEPPPNRETLVDKDGIFDITVKDTILETLSTMKYLPQEITKTIVDHVGKHDDYLSRQDLRNLRLVNKYFYQFATPILFQTVPFWLGLSSLEHLTLISEHPQMYGVPPFYIPYSDYLPRHSSQYVTKLLFSPLRFVKFKDPFSYQSSVRNRLERDTFSHNIFSLSFGKHVTAYKSYVEAQDYLSKKSQDTKILTRALRRLPRVKNLAVVFKNEIIGAREIMSAFGLLNGNEITLDSEYTLQVLIEALSKSERQLDIFSLVSNERPPFELYSESRRDFNDKHESRFKYVSESPLNVTATAFENAFNGGNDKMRQKVIHLMRNLREFSMSGLEIDSIDAFAVNCWSCSLEPIVAFASVLEELYIAPNVSRTPGRNHPKLHLSTILHHTVYIGRLRYLTLHHVESPEPILINLFTRCSCALEIVVLLDVHVTGGGSWSEVFRKSRNADFNMLSDFRLLHCGGAKGLVRAENYLKRLTSKDPIAECNEKQNDDLD